MELGIVSARVAEGAFLGMEHFACSTAAALQLACHWSGSLKGQAKQQALEFLRCMCQSSLPDRWPLLLASSVPGARPVVAVPLNMLDLDVLVEVSGGTVNAAMLLQKIPALDRPEMRPFRLLTKTP
eukprot:10357125-Lingulodinium_polyedra.AAC.1